MQKPRDWKIRHAKDDDVEEAVALLRTCLGTGSVPRNVDFWRWKHERNPFGPSPVLLATAGGRIVGLRAFLRWNWLSGTRRVTAVRAVDTATHPDWRGRGVFSHLTRELADRMAEEGVAFVFNTPNKQSGSGYLKMGWSQVGRLPIYIRPLRWSALLHPARGDATALGRLPDGLRSVTDFLRQPQTESFLLQLDRQRRDLTYRTAADPTYLRWRYAEPPGLDYRACWAGQADAAAAIVLRLRRRRGLLELSVSEILAAPNPASITTAARLLSKLGSTTLADYAVAIATPATAEHAALRRAKFFRLPAAGPFFFARSLRPAPDLPPPADPRSWRFGAGCFELF